jgi:hypothetical protein
MMKKSGRSPSLETGGPVAVRSFQIFTLKVTIPTQKLQGHSIFVAVVLLHSPLTLYRTPFKGNHNHVTWAVRPRACDSIFEADSTSL